MKAVINGSLFLFGLIFALVFNFSANAQSLKLDRGTMSLGGTIGLSIDTVIPEGGSSVSGVLFDLRTGVGCFINGNVEFRSSVTILAGGGDLYEDSSTDFGFTIGFGYYHSVGRLKPYICFDIGMVVVAPDRGDNIEAFLITIPAGLLVALNDNVAIDVGARLDVVMSLEDGGGTGLRIPIGYGGLRAFF